ncbi:short-chain dehydrogenase/reductase-like protein SDR [Thozetella sp. PMI_491]|nr:short-chain dehydrogenase/reductase-like protein SDR [Thozetella sp. PMI_491]
MEAPKRQPYHLPKDAVWFITGCSSGIGRALAETIASKPGLRLVATARKVASLDYLPSSDNILKLPLDVTSTESVDAAIAAALAKWGRLDVVVNNAGYTLQGDTENAAEEDTRRIVETDFWGTVRVTKHAMRVLREENPKTGQQGGVVMNVTSLGGRVAFPGNAFYHSSKFAVEGFTESVSREVRPDWGINFCLIEPGGTKTNYATSSMKTIPVHPAYAAPDMPTRMLEAYIDDPEMQKQWASPYAVAAAMYGVVARGEVVPLRVPLGPDVWGVLKADVSEADKALDEIKETSFSVSEIKDAELVTFLGDLR